MAVSKLNKLTILAEKQEQDVILTLLQGLQQIEIENVVQETDNQEWLTTYFPEMAVEQNNKEATYQYLLGQINEAVQFIRHYGSAKQKIVSLKRSEMDIFDLEQQFDEEQLRQTLEKVLALKDKWEASQKAFEKWSTQESWASKWQRVDIRSDEQLEYAAVFLANVPENRWESVREILVNEHIYFDIHESTKTTVAFSGIYLKKQASLLAQLSALGVEFEENPYEQSPKNVLKIAKEKLAEIVEQQNLYAIEGGYFKKQVAYLQLNEEILRAKITREQIKKTLAQSNYIVVIRGWAAEQELAAITTQLERVIGREKFYFSTEKPTRKQIIDNQVPTKLSNHRLIQPFESLTAMYALPKYEEIDPTPWMAPFYLVFFGMMIADLGYGSLMLLATTFALMKIALPTNTRKFVQLFQLLSFSVIFWGVIYGSAFGVTLPFQLLSPTNDFMTIFMISLIFGGIQIFTGLFLAAKENIKHKQYLSAIGSGFAWQGLLAGIFIGAGGALLWEMPAVTNTGITVAIISALLIVVIPTIQSKSKVGGFFSGLYELYGITGYIGDFVSYSRLMALGISGGSIAMAFNMLVGTMPPAARFSVGIILIILLQGLNLFLSLLGAYVHAARLQYVEFFGKFYQGGGRAFRPFKADEKYLNIQKRRNKS